MAIDEKKKKEADKKIGTGEWLRVRATIEVLARTEKNAESALEKHIGKMEKDKRMIIYRKEKGEAKKIEKPFPHIPEAYSVFMELEFVAHRFETLVFTVMAYGPSTIEILEPNNMKLEIGELQGILNTVSGMMHQFAQTGAGGLLIST